MDSVLNPWFKCFVIMSLFIRVKYQMYWCEEMKDMKLKGTPISHYQPVLLKFVFFEKATKFDKISFLLLTNNFVLFVSRYSFEYQSGSQSWNFVHWDQPNPSKVCLFLDTDKFILSFLLISNKNQLCRI